MLTHIRRMRSKHTPLFGALELNLSLTVDSYRRAALGHSQERSRLTFVGYASLLV